MAVIVFCYIIILDLYDHIIASLHYLPSRVWCERHEVSCVEALALLVGII
jgi:hypothetical protein